MPRPRSPVEPIATVVDVLLLVFIISLPAFVIGMVLPLAGVTEAFVSVDVPGPTGAGDGVPLGRWSVRPDVTPNTLGLRLFDATPDLAQQIWYAMTRLSDTTLLLAALVLTFHLIRRTRRDGLYSTATARRLRVLGWVLVAGSLAGMVVTSLARNQLLATMVNEDVGWLHPITPDAPWTVLLTGAGILTFARIMRIGVAMRKDLEGTV
jgi:hypothetical protein